MPSNTTDILDTFTNLLIMAWLRTSIVSGDDFLKGLQYMVLNTCNTLSPYVDNENMNMYPNLQFLDLSGMHAIQ